MSKTYSRKLQRLFKEVELLIAAFPLSGRATDEQDVRVRVESNFLLFYKVYDKEILIVKVWDGRRNPEDLKLK